MITILVGPGINHLVDVEELPVSGAELHLESVALTAGTYRLTRDGGKKWCGQEYPFYRFKRISDLPPGIIPIPMAVMNC